MEGKNGEETEVSDDIFFSDTWYAKLADAEKRLGADVGFKLLYTPWATLIGPEVVFLSLNPMNGVPEEAPYRSVSDERGNSYEVELPVAKPTVECHRYFVRCNGLVSS